MRSDPVDQILLAKAIERENELRAERDEAREIVAKCNNSVFGSYGYFTAASGKTLPDAIEDLKASSRKDLEKAIADADLVQLFDDLIEFLDDQADADGDSEGFYPNRAMRLSSAVTAAARALGWEA